MTVPNEKYHKLGFNSKQYRYGTYGVLACAVLLLIAGAVMLGIGISKNNDDSVSNNNQSMTTAEPTFEPSSTITTLEPTYQPLSTIGADIVIVIDGTVALTQQAFADVKNYIAQLSSNFDIGPLDTQFSVLLFDSGSTPLSGSFFLSSASNQTDLQSQLNSMPFPNSNATQWNLLGATKYVMNSVLTESQGARQLATMVIYIGSSSSTINNCDAIQNQAGIPLAQRVQGVYAIAINSPNSTVGYLHCVVPLSQEVAQTATSAGLTTGSEIDAKLKSFISKAYQTYIDSYSLTMPLRTKKVDLVFLIDQTSYTVKAFGQIRQFLIQYVANFDIGPDAAQVGVVGFTNMNVPYINLSDTSNLQDLQTKISQIPPGDGTEDSPNVHDGLEFILQNTFQPRYGRRIDVPAVVVVLLGSNQLQPLDYGRSTAIWRLTSICGISLFGYPETTDELVWVARSARAVGRVHDVNDLMSSNSVAVQQISYFILNSQPQRPVPLLAVHSDFVVVIDSTVAFVEGAFNNTIKWLKSFVAYFPIDPQSSMFSVALFDSSPLPGTIYFNSASDNSTLQSKIDQLKYAKSSVQEFNLLGATQYVTNELLTTANGWRGRSTMVIFIAISNYTAHNCDEIMANGTKQLSQKADVYGMALNDQKSTEAYLDCVITPYPRMNFVRANPYSFLISGGLTDTVLVNEATRSFQLWIDGNPFSLPTPLMQTKLDIVFLVDQTSFLSQESFTILKKMMTNFVGQFQIGFNNTMFSVVGYDQAIVGSGSFLLSHASTQETLTAAVNNLQWMNSSALSFGSSEALDYVINQVLRPENGHSADRAAAVIILASSPVVADQLDSNQISQLNSLGGVYGVDVTGFGAAANYLIQVTKNNDMNIYRSNGADKLTPNSEGFQRLNSFVSTEYFQWTQRKL